MGGLSRRPPQWGRRGIGPGASAVLLTVPAVHVPVAVDVAALLPLVAAALLLLALAALLLLAVGVAVHALTGALGFLGHRVLSSLAGASVAPRARETPEGQPPFPSDTGSGAGVGADTPVQRSAQAS